MGGDNFRSNHWQDCSLRPSAYLRVLCVEKFSTQRTQRYAETTEFDSLLVTFLDDLLDRLAQLSRVDASDVLVNDLALLVVQVRCRQIALPSSIDKIDRGLGVRDVEQVRRHLRVHQIEKLRHLVFDLAHVVKRHRDKLQRAWPVVLIDLHEIGKLVTTRIAKRGPEVNEQGTLALLRNQTFERFDIDRRYNRQRFAWLRGAAPLSLSRRRKPH